MFRSSGGSTELGGGELLLTPAGSGTRRRAGGVHGSGAPRTPWVVGGVQLGAAGVDEDVRGLVTGARRPPPPLQAGQPKHPLSPIRKDKLRGGSRTPPLPLGRCQLINANKQSTGKKKQQPFKAHLPAHACPLLCKRSSGCRDWGQDLQSEQYPVPHPAQVPVPSGAEGEGRGALDAVMIAT